MRRWRAREGVLVALRLSEVLPGDRYGLSRTSTPDGALSKQRSPAAVNPNHHSAHADPNQEDDQIRPDVRARYCTRHIILGR